MKVLKLIIVFALFSIQSFSQNQLNIQGGNVIISGSEHIILNNCKWVNDGNFQAGNSTVSFTGTSTDEESAIDGNSMSTFFNLEINKASNGIQLIQDIQVDQELQMSDGQLDLNTFILTLGTANGIIINESELNRIIGPLGGEVVKTLDLNIPVDVNPGNIGVSITSASNLGTTTIRRAHLAQLIDGEISIFRTYDIAPANNVGLNATAQFYYFNGELNTNVEATLKPFRFDGSTWADWPVTDNNPVINFVETNQINSFSLWTLSDRNPVVPIELLFFEVRKTEEDWVQLNWQTVTETNNDYFTIERSLDGINFTALEKISGAGNSLESIQYETFDFNPAKGFNYYRLKQTDFNETFTYSAVQAVYFDRDLSALTIFPNPTSGIVQISQGDISEETQLKIYSVTGKLLRVQQLNPGVDLHSVSLEEFPKGTYLLKITAQNRTSSKKIILQ